MEDLFRFIMTRPAQKAAAETPSVPVTPNTDYHGQLRQAKAEGLDAVRRVALARLKIGLSVSGSYGPMVECRESITIRWTANQYRGG